MRQAAFADSQRPAGDDGLCHACRRGEPPARQPLRRLGNCCATLALHLALPGQPLGFSTRRRQCADADANAALHMEKPACRSPRAMPDLSGTSVSCPAVHGLTRAWLAQLGAHRKRRGLTRCLLAAGGAGWHAAYPAGHAGRPSGQGWQFRHAPGWGAGGRAPEGPHPGEHGHDAPPVGPQRSPCEHPPWTHLLVGAAVASPWVSQPCRTLLSLGALPSPRHHTPCSHGQLLSPPPPSSLPCQSEHTRCSSRHCQGCPQACPASQWWMGT